MICPSCKRENKNTNIKCEFCGIQLINLNSFNNRSPLYLNSNITNKKEIKIPVKKIGCLTSILIFIFSFPIVLAGCIFLFVGTYFGLSERIKTVDYKKTTARLIGHTNCTYDSSTKLCEAVYEYTVNDKNYTVSPNELTSQGNFKETTTVYYNPNNPNEALIYAKWGELAFSGIIMLGVIAIILISIRKYTKKISNGKDDITLNI